MRALLEGGNLGQPSEWFNSDLNSHQRYQAREETMDIGVDSGALLIHVFIILFIIKECFANSEDNE
ncbi:hypothetical protein BM528_13065 [Alteromonas sp. RW2A1]|nr:hypothetical protein BM528_13065 [Alteromonas sp. RW2A1]